jgi:glycosyltransferase involved in cell wall biosynthesis
VWPGLGAAATPRAIAGALLPVVRALHADAPFDVIDAEYFWPDGPAAMRLADALGLPFSIKARGSDIHFWGRQAEIGGQIVEAGTKAGGLLAVSAALKRDMVALGLPEDRISVHRTGVDLDLFRPVDRAAAKAALGVAGPLLVAAGALIARKGQDIVIDALAALPRATLLLVGDGPNRGALEAQARRLGVADRVRFLGSRPHADLPALLAAADVMVLPTASEGLANVWVEALACGTPVVTADVGGAREVIDRPEAGRLVARDPDAVASAIGSLLADPPDRTAVREAAQKFSWDANRDALFDHLSGLVAGSR